MSGEKRAVCDIARSAAVLFVLTAFFTLFGFSVKVYAAPIQDEYITAPASVGNMMYDGAVHELFRRNAVHFRQNKKYDDFGIGQIRVGHLCSPHVFSCDAYYTPKALALSFAPVLLEKKGKEKENCGMWTRI